MLLLLALVGCDHATKVVAKVTLGDGRVHGLIPGVLDLMYTENRDTAFSLTRGLVTPAKEWLLVSLACLTLVSLAVAWWKRRARADALENVAFVLVVGGALGNVTDRIARGYVTDFIHLEHWPIFNVADVAVCLGALLLGVTFTRQRARAPLPRA